VTPREYCLRLLCIPTLLVAADRSHGRSGELVYRLKDNIKQASGPSEYVFVTVNFSCPTIGYDSVIVKSDKPVLIAIGSYNNTGVNFDG
jgi:hypothetical protein